MTDQTAGSSPAHSAPEIDDQLEQLDQADGEQPSTTHAEWGAGEPHLRITSPNGERSRLELTEDRITIGSGAECALVIPGADPVHATIVHDERDEYVLTLHGEGLMNASPSDGIDGDRSEILRTGARFTVAEWILVFGREEFADHGRPFGGREGGELDDQPPQPARPDYSAEHAEVDADERRAAEAVRDERQGTGTSEQHGDLEVKDG